MEEKTKALVFAMLMEDTGIAMGDSGGGGGRMWQRNAMRDIRKDEPVTIDLNLDKEGKGTSDDVNITVSLYHYLPEVLELDDTCDEFNNNPANVKEWDSEVYGVSKRGVQWLTRKGLTIGDSWNSYNGESNLSQVLQGTEIGDGRSDYGDYVLLQIHGGADVRGGYTDAKLFKYKRFQEVIDTCPRVSAMLYKKTGEEIALDMRESGYGFVKATENGYGGEVIPIVTGDRIEASL